ncbi:MAG TPA: hypothetical protein VGL66_06535 [Caulobacteraceae bacterium]|jgi:hypothetical protein
MSFGGSSSKSSTTQTSTPNPLTTQLYDPTFQQASTDFNQPVSAYTGELYPGMTAAQTQAGQMVENDVGMGSQAVSDAVNTATGLSDYAAPQVTAPTVQGASLGPAAQATAQGYAPTMATAATAGPAALSAGAAIDPSAVQSVSSTGLTGTDLSAYMNPYVSSVIDPALQQMEQQRQQAITQTQGQATQAGAFGGSREGVADALTNQAWGNTEAQEIGNLYNTGYQQAAQNAETDASRALQAGEANQQTDLAAGTTDAGLLSSTNALNAGALNSLSQYLAGLEQQTSLANQGASNTASQFGAGAANTASLANQSADDAIAEYLAGLQEQTGLAQVGYDMSAQTSNQNAGLASAGLDLNSASALAGYGAQQQSMGLTGANAVNAYGTEEQQTQAAQDAAAYADYQRQITQSIDEGQGDLGLLGSLFDAYAGATQKANSNSSSTNWSVNPLQVAQGLAMLPIGG